VSHPHAGILPAFSAVVAIMVREFIPNTDWERERLARMRAGWTHSQRSLPLWYESSSEHPTTNQARTGKTGKMPVLRRTFASVSHRQSANGSASVSLACGQDGRILSGRCHYGTRVQANILRRIKPGQARQARCLSYDCTSVAETSQ
jgi:hypothetical protein